MPPVTQFVAQTVPWAILALLLSLVLLSLPWRRERTFALRRVIAAPRGEVWRVFIYDADNPRSVAVHPNVVEKRIADTDPPVEEIVLDASGGHGTRLLTVRSEILACDEAARHTSRLVQVGERVHPFGRATITDAAFADHSAGTLATLTWRGETATLWQYLALRFGMSSYLRRLARYSAPDSALPAPGRRRPWVSLGLSALAVVSFVLWFGWKGGAILVGTLIVHEFGHWLAFRVTGHPAPRIVLIPFLGGVAVGNHPHRSEFEAAFVALMGPAFSIVSLALLLAAVPLAMPWEVTTVDGWADIVRHFPAPERYARDIAAAVFLMSVVNLLQLLPVLPLDGGQVLRAVMQSAGAAAARWTVMGFAAAGMAAALWFGDHILAAVAALGLTGAWHMAAVPSTARPMNAVGLAVIGLGYFGAVAIYLAAVAFGLRAFDIAVRL